MAAKKVSIVEPPKELGEFSPPPESPAEIKARIAAEREAEQKELDEEWKKIPYVDQKKLGPGVYAGFDMNCLLKPWQQVCNSSLVSYSSMPFILHCSHHTSFVSMDPCARSSSAALVLHGCSASNCLSLYKRICFLQVKEHPHDFYTHSRLSRPTDIAKHYEFGELLKVMKQLKECIIELRYA